MLKYIKLPYLRESTDNDQLPEPDFHVEKSFVLQIKTQFVIQLYCNFLTRQKLPPSFVDSKYATVYVMSSLSGFKNPRTFCITSVARILQWEGF